jgi:hypothetical protein
MMAAPFVMQMGGVDTFGVPAIGWLLAWIVAFTAVTSAARAAGAVQRNFAQGALGKYLPREMAQEIINNPELLALHGEKKSIYVLFSDLEGFTKMSHAIEPEMVAKLQQREGAIRKDLANRQRIDREIAAQLTELQLRPKWEDDFNPSEDNSANGAKVNKPSRLSPKISPESQKVITVKPVENASVEGPVNNRIGAVVDPPRAQPFVGLGGRMVISNTQTRKEQFFCILGWQGQFALASK